MICPIQEIFYWTATPWFDASVGFNFSSDNKQSNRVVFSVRFASPSVRFCSTLEVPLEYVAAFLIAKFATLYVSFNLP